MSNVSHDFVSVDMRGLKAALVARAHALRVSVSSIMRSAAARELGLEGAAAPSRSEGGPMATNTIKLSIRLSRAEAEQLAEGARAAGMSRGAYIASLVGGVPVLSPRADHVAALTASCAELATLSRNINHLTTLLRQSSVRAAQEYREMLDSLTAEVRRHLRVAADALADLRSRRVSSGTSRPTKEMEREHA